jgi:holo-[acyl-carrier protein] synthase
MKIATGIDLIEVERVKGAVERHGERFLARVFTELEREQAGGSMASLAARFAAKEAVAKALGCGIGDVMWVEIEVRRPRGCAPEIYLRGAAARLAEELGLTQWSVSLTHTQGMAGAVVVASGD